MGNSLASLGNLFGFGRIEKRALFIGLDATGKTTLLYKLVLGEVVTTIPTIGFNVETVKHNHVTFMMWDVGLRDKSRPLLRHYTVNTDALIIMVDSTDRERFEELVDLIHYTTVECDFPNTAVIMALANKQDLPGAMSAVEVEKRLSKFTFINPISQKKENIKVFPTIATEGVGIFEALDWLDAELSGRKLKKAAIEPWKEVAQDVKTDTIKGYQIMTGTLKNLMQTFQTSSKV